MEFEEAKKALSEEWVARHAQWDAERKERIAAGKADGLDSVFQRLEERGPRVWSRRVYWRVRRPIEALLRGYAYGSAKNTFLRGKRGWGQQDWWNLSNYLSEWLPDALRYMAAHSNGHPMEVTDHDGTKLYELWDKNDWTTDSVRSLGSDEVEPQHIWEETLERMAQGFEAFDYLCDHGWHNDTEAERELTRIRDEGMKLFMNNFGALWD